ncbi:apolipoprotein N-acyltransferase [Candidatus Bandiella numerosa]|uniref:apolipoprotein N-acyltransferase n=1 Tax=Candidatus Bandiella numerosa TaxID=2570586 RepID=UPI001F006600|nr:apolipoprotein N-acyltransferase [Candidatus Bandiella numerosa]
MNIANFYILISPLLGLSLTLAFFPISAFPFIISLGIFAFILRKINGNLRLFLHGLLFGYGFFIIQTYWIPFSIYKANINMEWAVPFLSLLIPVAFAIVIGILAILTKYIRHNNVIYSINFAFLWVILEYIRSNVFFPFNWGLLGYTAISVPWFNNMLAYIGSYGVSFLLALFSTSLFTKNKIFIISNILLFVCVCVIGEVRKEEKNNELKSDHAIKIRLVQPNIQQPHYGDSEKQAYIFETLSKLTLSPGFENMQYIFWPEASFPYPIIENSKWFDGLKNFVPMDETKNSALIFGTDRLEKNEEKLLSYNSLIALNRKGEILGYYDKRILVPFGEYMPYKNTNKLVRKMAHSVNFDDISKGSTRNIIELDDNIAFLPLICSESTLAKNHLSLSSYRKYRFILNITNDSWFENTFGPHQHYVISRVKAMEFGLPVIRVANTGVSAIINAYGDLIKTAQINTEAVIDGVIPPKLKNPTLYYVIQGHIIPAIFTLYSIFLILVFIFRKELSNE